MSGLPNLWRTCLMYCVSGEACRSRIGFMNLLKPQWPYRTKLLSSMSITTEIRDHCYVSFTFSEHGGLHTEGTQHLPQSCHSGVGRVIVVFFSYLFCVMSIGLINKTNALLLLNQGQFICKILTDDSSMLLLLSTCTLSPLISVQRANTLCSCFQYDRVHFVFLHRSQSKINLSFNFRRFYINAERTVRIIAL